jgi:hypothetical protein
MNNKKPRNNYWQDITGFLATIGLFYYTSVNYDEIVHFKPDTSTYAMVFSFVIRQLNNYGGEFTVYGFYMLLMVYFMIGAFIKYERSKNIEPNDIPIVTIPPFISKPKYKKPFKRKRRYNFR